MSGYAPLSFTTIDSWARLMDINVQPYEVRALMALDAAISNPKEPEEEDEEEEAPRELETRQRGRWPSRKAEPETAKG